MNVKIFEFEIQTRWKNRLKYNFWVVAKYVITFASLWTFAKCTLFKCHKHIVKLSI